MRLVGQVVESLTKQGQLVADKKSYAPGDTARFTVKSGTIDRPLLVTKETQMVSWRQVVRPGAGGAFELKGLPPGTYTIEAWHEKLGTQTQTVTLGARETKPIAFTFKI